MGFIDIVWRVSNWLRYIMLGPSRVRITIEFDHEHEAWRAAHSLADELNRTNVMGGKMVDASDLMYLKQGPYTLRGEFRLFDISCRLKVKHD